MPDFYALIVYDEKKGVHIMQGYESKKALIAEIEKTANLFINEFLEVAQDDKDKLITM